MKTCISEEYRCEHNVAFSTILMKNELIYFWFCTLQCSSTFETGQHQPTNPYAFRTSFFFSFFYSLSLSKDVFFFTNVLPWKPALKTELLQLACLTCLCFCFLTACAQVFKVDLQGKFLWISIPKCISHKQPVRYI